MKRSVVIIAHNEDQHIEHCIASILEQTLVADEVMLVAHNCTDETIAIASRFPTVTIRELHGTSGIVFARMEGISHASGDRIFCIDGDAHAKKNWIESLDRLLDRSPTSLVGSFVVYTGNLFWTLGNISNFIISFLQKEKASWVWGPSFAFSKELSPLILESLQEFPAIAEHLHLSGYPDDYWMALKCKQHADVLQTHATVVCARTKEKSFMEGLRRSLGSTANVPLMKEYLRNEYGK